jgi:hypothetical protein
MKRSDEFWRKALRGKGLTFVRRELQQRTSRPGKLLAKSTFFLRSWAFIGPRTLGWRDNLPAWRPSAA